jgi:hypothetical protein
LSRRPAALLAAAVLSHYAGTVAVGTELSRLELVRLVLFNDGGLRANDGGRRAAKAGGAPAALLATAGIIQNAGAVSVGTELSLLEVEFFFAGHLRFLKRSFSLALAFSTL